VFGSPPEQAMRIVVATLCNIKNIQHTYSEILD
jgi:hypothetical protein